MRIKTPPKPPIMEHPEPWRDSPLMPKKILDRSLRDFNDSPITDFPTDKANSRKDCMKLCENCRHFEHPFYCANDKAVVHGRLSSTCGYERGPFGKCGNEGKLWQSAESSTPSLFQRLIRFLKGFFK